MKCLFPFIVIAVLFLTGCDKTTSFHTNLREREANLIMAELMSAGIGCHKMAGNDGLWNVMINEKKFAEATFLLERKGLPHRSYDGISETFKKTGMVSSPSEERIRYMAALSQDLARTITAIDGIVDSYVHVVLPNNDPFARTRLVSSASVAIRTHWDMDISEHIPSIKNLIKNSVEGLEYDKITVTVFPDLPPSAKK